MIELRHVTKRYGQTAVRKNITLSVDEPGSAVCSEETERGRRRFSNRLPDIRILRTASFGLKEQEEIKMKKIILTVVCLIVGCFVLAGCSDSSDPFTQEEYEADASQIEEIRIDVRDRQIEVSESEDERIRIVYSENSEETYDISVSDENVLTMTNAGDREWTDYIGGKPSVENRKISLQVPDALLNNLTLSTTNEDISLSALTVTGEANISSNGGNISFEKLGVGDAMYLTVKNGDISGTVAGSYDDFAIRSEIKKGECSLPEQKDGGAKTLNVSGNNGDIDIAFTGGSL